MKFFLPILLAAPAVMGRACKVRHSHSSAVEPVHTQYPVPEPVISQAPTVVSQKSSPVEVKTTASKPKTTKPKKVSKPKASKPKTSKPKTTKPSTPKTSTPSTGSGSKSTPIGNGASVSGSSTFYGGNLAGGNCMFSTYTLPSGILGTAFSGQKWDNAANCGACIEVTGPSGTIKAMVRPSALR